MTPAQLLAYGLYVRVPIAAATEIHTGAALWPCNNPAHEEATVRTPLSVLAIPAILTLALVFAAPREAHAFGGIGYVGYGYTFADEDNDPFGPTIEVGGTFSVPFLAIDLTYWNALDDAGDMSQIRLGARVSPPIVPLYARAAVGLPLDGDVRDAMGVDAVLGVGATVFSLPLIKLNIEVDYHLWTDSTDIHPLEGKVGVVIAF